MGRKLFNIGLGDDILDLIPKVKATKAKINKQDYIKLKFLQNKLDRKATYQMGEFENHVSDKGLVSKYIKNSKLNRKTKNKHKTIKIDRRSE